MKANVFEKYGSPDVLEFKDVDTPTPKSNEVLVKVHASSVNFADYHVLLGSPFMLRFVTGLTKPRSKILGNELAGRIEAVGKNVTQFNVSDDIFADVFSYGRGAYAEYKCVPENALVKMPSGTTYEQVATIPTAGLTALQGLRKKGEIQPGEKILINGASGGVGSYAVLIAKSFGAEVTGVCSTKKMEMVRSIGADYVIDYKKEDFTKNGKHYDLILDVAAYRPMSNFKESLISQGVYVLVGGSTGRIMKAQFFGSMISKKGGKKFCNMGPTKTNKDDMVFLSEHIKSGKISPAITKRYPLSKVADALRYFGDGLVQGKIVITYE